MEQASPPPLSDMLTVEEAAKELQLAPSSIYRMIHENVLVSRKATLTELGLLEQQRRISPGSTSGRGRDLITAASVQKAKGRPAPGWPRKKTV